MVLLPDRANAIKTTLIGTNQGAPWMNTIYFFAEGGFGDPAAETTALGVFNEAVGTAWNASIAPLCNPLVILQQVNSVDLTTRSAPQSYSTLPVARVGTRTGTPLPTSAAMVISWRVNLRYRGGHGRIYVPAGNVADVVNGRTWLAGFRATAATAAAGFHTALDGLSVGAVQVNHVVLSYFSGSHKTEDNKHPEPVLRSTPLPIPITQGAVGGRVDTQRRRLGKETL